MLKMIKDIWDKDVNPWDGFLKEINKLDKDCVIKPLTHTDKEAHFQLSKAPSPEILEHLRNFYSGYDISIYTNLNNDADWECYMEVSQLQFYILRQTEGLPPFDTSGEYIVFDGGHAGEDNPVGIFPWNDKWSQNLAKEMAIQQCKTLNNNKNKIHLELIEERIRQLNTE